MVVALAVSDDGQRVCAACKSDLRYSKTMEILIWQTVDPESEPKSWSFESGAVSAAFSSDCRFALLGYMDGWIRVYDLLGRGPGGKSIEVFSEGRHTGWVDSVSISPDGRFALSAGEDKKVIYWVLPTAVTK